MNVAIRVTDSETGGTGTVYEVGGRTFGSAHRPPLYVVEWDNEHGATGVMDVPSAEVEE